MFFTQFRDLAARRSSVTFQRKNRFNLRKGKADGLRFLYECDAPYNVSTVKTVVRFRSCRPWHEINTLIIMERLYAHACLSCDRSYL